MGVYSRTDGKYWMLWLPTAPIGQQREKTHIVVGTTVAQRHDSKKQAEALFHQRMNELAAHVHHMPIRREDELFRTYAAVYETDTIPTHKGAERERELLKQLLPFFGRHPITAIDQDLVRVYWKERRATVVVEARPGRPARRVQDGTIDREVDLLKIMLRDAVPKYLTTSPLAGMKRLGAKPKPKRRLLGDELERLLTVGDAQDRALLLLGESSLLRLSNCLGIRRTDRVGNWINLDDSKTGDGAFEVPLSPRAAAALDAIPDDGPFYFSKFRKALNPRDWRGSVRQRLEYLCKTAQPPVPFGHLAGGITFHGATRKTGATRMLQKEKQTVSTVQKLGRWKNPDVLLEIYNEVERAELLAAVGAPADPTLTVLSAHEQSPEMLKENAG